MTKLIKRLIKAIKEKGVLNTLVAGQNKICIFIYQKMNNYNYVFKYFGRTESLVMPDDSTIFCYSEINSIPEETLDAIRNDLSEDRLNTYLTGIKHYGCKLWILTVGSVPVCYAASRVATSIPHWFQPLEKDDEVIMLVITLEQHRGKGYAPILLNGMSESLSDEKRSVYIDCKIYNTASQRSIEKSGFQLISKKKAISEHWHKNWKED